MRHARWRHRAVAVALVALASPPQSVNAAPAPPRAKEVTLTTGLRLEWTGVTGVRLRIPSVAHLPGYAARLYVRGGTYAGVRMGWTSTCQGKPCGGVSMTIDHTPAIANHIRRNHPAGQRHVAYVTNAGEVPADTWDLYLFTDGHATLVFDETGLPKRPRTYRPAGRVRGSFRHLPEFCGTQYCTPGHGYAERVRTGGASGDTGRFGSADGWVFHYRPTYDNTPQGLHARGCAYRWKEGDTGKPAEDHPFGCDDEAERGTTDAWVTNLAFSGMPPYYSSVGRGMGVSDATGPVYLGYQVANEHDLVDTDVEAWGLWYEYGIR